MKILICYMTNSGSTYLAAREIARVLEQKKHTIALKRADAIEYESLLDYDVFILGSPSWFVHGKEGQPHAAMQELIEYMRGEPAVQGKRTALFGTGDNNYTDFCGAVDIMRTNLTSMGIAVIHPDLKLDEFYFHLDERIQSVRDWATSVASALAKK